MMVKYNGMRSSTVFWMSFGWVLYQFLKFLNPEMTIWSNTDDHWLSVAIYATGCIFTSDNAIFDTIFFQFLFAIISIITFKFYLKYNTLR